MPSSLFFVVVLIVSGLGAFILLYRLAASIGSQVEQELSAGDHEDWVKFEAAKQAGQERKKDFRKCLYKATGYSALVGCLDSAIFFLEPPHPVDLTTHFAAWVVGTFLGLTVGRLSFSIVSVRSVLNA